MTNERKAGRPVEPDSVASTVKGLLMEGAETERIIATVQRRHPKSRIDRAGVSWYRTWLRKHGFRLPTARRGT